MNMEDREKTLESGNTEKGWLIAEFKESNCTKPSCAIIAKNWHVSENVCRYPNTKDVFRRKTLTEKCEQYTPKWQYCDINRILKTDITDFKEALKYLEEFEDHSEVDSELTDSSPQKSPIRKKVVKSKPKIIDASQNLFNLPPPPAWKDNLPPPPPQKETPISRKGNPSSAASTNISSGDLTAAQNSRQSEKIVNSSPQNGENSKSRPEDNQLDVEVETNLNITFPTPPNNTNNTGLSNSDETGPWIMTKERYEKLFKEAFTARKNTECLLKIGKSVPADESEKRFETQRFVLMRPLNTTDEWDELTKCLESNVDLQKKLEEELVLTGGTKIAVVHKDIMMKVMTNDLCSQFSWAGKQTSTLKTPKRRFKNTPISNIIKQSMRVILGADKVTDAEYQTYTENFLSQAPFRLPGKRKKKSVENVNEPETRQIPQKDPVKEKEVPVCNNEPEIEQRAQQQDSNGDGPRCGKHPRMDNVEQQHVSGKDFIDDEAREV